MMAPTKPRLPSRAKKEITFWWRELGGVKIIERSVRWIDVEGLQGGEDP